MTGTKVRMCESKQLDEIAELLMSARADIVVNKNFIAAVEAINVALDEIAAIEMNPRISLITRIKKLCHRGH